MPSRQKLYLSNWSSLKQHGPGRKLTIMACPRPWELGVGKISMLAPEVSDLRAIKSGEMPIMEYLEKFEARLKVYEETPALSGYLRRLRATDQTGRTFDVQDGDTLCCACAALRLDSPQLLKKRHTCHIELVAPVLVRAGWDVRLYGVDLELRDGQVYRLGRPYSWRDPIPALPAG